MKRIGTVFFLGFLFLLPALVPATSDFVTVATDDRGVVLEFTASGYGFQEVPGEGADYAVCAGRSH